MCTKGNKNKLSLSVCVRERELGGFAPGKKWGRGHITTFGPRERERESGMAQNISPMCDTAKGKRGGESAVVGGEF